MLLKMFPCILQGRIKRVEVPQGMWQSQGVSSRSLDFKEGTMASEVDRALRWCLELVA